MYNGSMSLETVTEAIRKKIAFAPGLKARAKFNFGDDGIVYVDTTQSPPEISGEDKESDVELVCTADTFQAILDGRQDPNMAFMMGKLKIRGSMGLAMKLNALLED